MTKARIYKPSRSTMQSGSAVSSAWVLEYEIETPRRAEPLMGWIGSGDTLNQVRLKFDAKEAAIAFAEKKGMEYTIQEPHEKRIPPKNYADNFRDREARRS